MNKFGLLNTTAIGSAVFGVSLLFASPAMAQEPIGATQQDECDQNDPDYNPTTGQCAPEDGSAQAGSDPDAEGGRQIVVTGSRIPRPEFSGNLPGVQVDQEQIQTRGFTNAIEVINDIPLTGVGADLRGTNGAGQPTALGLGFVDLLDLGTARTLTLVNGRRFVGGNTATLFAFGNETGGQVDVNNIPTLLIERVDVVTVGGAAAYGSDAIAGVVNFILRDDFEGTDFTGIVNVTERGDGFGYNLRALHGMNFAGDRGNVTINAEYARIDAINAIGRPFLRDNPFFVANPANGGIRNPAFAATIPATAAFQGVSADLAPGSIGINFATSLATSLTGNIFEPLSATLPAQNRVAANPGAQTFISGASQLIPGTTVGAAAAGCATTNPRFCNFAPSALPGNAAAQATFAQSVLAAMAPTFVAQGTQAQRNALALSLLQANRPTPREFFAQNPNVPVNAFVGQFIGGFVDVANPNTTPVTIAGQTVPLNTILPRIAVPLRFDQAGNVQAYDPGYEITAGTASTFTTAAARNGFFDPTTFLVRPQQDRYLANLIGHFDITDDITFFTENLFAHVKAVNPRSTATGNVVTTTAFETAALILNVNNPFLDDADRAALATFGITPQARNGNFVLSRTNQDILGDAPNTNRNRTYRSVMGFRGDFGAFGGNHNWELSGTYGRSQLRTTGFSIRDVEFALAVDTVRDSSGQIRCRSQVDPTAAQNLPGVQPNIIRQVGPDGIPREVVFTPTATPELIAACQPLNPFGFNQMSQASKDYVTAQQITNNLNEQLFFQGLLSGDVIELPGGTLQYALSGEYRRDEISIIQDELQQLGRTRSAPTSPTRGRLNTMEGGFELRIPIFGPDFNVPFFHSLEFNPSVRFTRQRGEAPAFRNIAGTLIEPEFRGDWESIFSLAGTWRPIADIALRGNYTRSIRQPNVVELFLTNQSAFAATLDPCSNQRISFAPNPALRLQNCAQLVVNQGIAPNIPAAVTFLNTFVSNDNSQPVAFAGNTGLRPEKGKSYTFGAIITPRVIPRLSLSADYINLRLDDQIIPTNPTQAAGFCVDSPTFPDTTPTFGTNLCSFIPRGADFQVQPGAAGQFLNLSSTEVEGINIAAAYRFDLPSDWGRIELRANGFHLLQYDTSATGDFSDRQRSAGSFNRPEWETVSSVRWEREEFYSQLTHRFQASTTLFSGGVPATIELADPFVYPELHTFDLALGWNLESGYRIQFAVTNLTDETFAGQTGLFNGVAFDNLGRRFQVAAGLRF